MSTFVPPAANDDVKPRSSADDLVGAYLAARRVQRRMTGAIAVLAVGLLTMTLVHGYQTSRTPPDIVTFAFRV